MIFRWKAFKKPKRIYYGTIMWGWSGRLNLKKLLQNIEIFKQMGFANIMPTSRSGLQTKYLGRTWLKYIERCVAFAKKKDMGVWIYDEDRWPSGYAGGNIDNKYAAKYLQIGNPANLANIINSYKYKISCNKESGKISYYRIYGNHFNEDDVITINIVREEKQAWYNNQSYVDLMDKNTTKDFIRKVHKKYIGINSNQNIIGFFTDEPNVFNEFILKDAHERLPWSNQIYRYIKKNKKYNIIDKLPELFFDIKDMKVHMSRIDYREAICNLFSDSYSNTIRKWCRENGVKYTGHLLGEESMLSQTESSGACMRFYQYMDIPGVDMHAEYKRDFNAVKMISSVANQFGKKWRMAEVYGGTGWNMNYAAFKAVGDWLAVLGVNMRVYHLAWSTMSGEAKKDYPGSINSHNGWWRSLYYIEDYFARVNYFISCGHDVRKVLVIYPIVNIWESIIPQNNRSKYHKNLYNAIENEFCNLTDELLCQHIDYDLVDENILQIHGSIHKYEKSIYLKILHAKYSIVIVPYMKAISKGTHKLLELFKSRGGIVLFSRSYPNYIIDRIADIFPKQIYNKNNICSNICHNKYIAEKGRLISIKDKYGREIPYIIFSYREDSDNIYLYFVNIGYAWFKNKDYRKKYYISDRNKDINVAFVTIIQYRHIEYSAIEYDLVSGLRKEVHINKENNIVLSFLRRESKAIIISKNIKYRCAKN